MFNDVAFRPIKVWKERFCFLDRMVVHAHAVRAVVAFATAVDGIQLGLASKEVNVILSSGHLSAIEAHRVTLFQIVVAPLPEVDPAPCR
ncbi:MAG: hypothetical protein AB7Q23_08265 [Hyphomonadaceae bacterium]